MKRIFVLIRRDKIHKVALIIFAVIFVGSVAFTCFEKKINFTDALWWSIVTITTVGYGDISPTTIGGRIVGMWVMLLGIGFLSLFTAAVASVFIENKFMENKGMKSTCFLNHFIICGWNFRGKDIVAELRSDAKSAELPIVIIADINTKPLDDAWLHFIRGEINAENLKKANINAADVVIVLSDEHLDSYARDAKTILNTMTIKDLRPEIYTCVELMDSKNLQHCKLAKADEIVIVGELATNLLVQAALDHGVTRIISELVSNRYGEEIYKINLPDRFINQTFFEAMCELKKKRNILCIGIENNGAKKFIANPNHDYKISNGDKMIIIAQHRPSNL